MEMPQLHGMEINDGVGITAAVRPSVGLQTPVSLISICPGDSEEDTEMIDEDEGGEDVGHGDEWEDYEESEEGGGCVDGRIEPDVVDTFIHGEENRQFKSKVWNGFIK
ncbi:hypothetical protein ACP4OV_015417 [Aristida adscensionis]